MTSVHDPRALRSAFGAFATGVTIITASHQGIDVGVTASSFNSVSLDPPLILWSLDRESRSLAVFTSSEAFAVHVLASDQDVLSNRFARSCTDKFDGLKFERGAADTPMLCDYAARFECRKAFVYDVGDHVIFVGEVIGFDQTDRAPLVFHGGRYKIASDLRQRSGASLPLATQLSLANMACRREAIGLAMDAGLAWADVSVLGALVQGGGSGEGFGKMLRALGIVIDASTRARLFAAGVAIEQDGNLAVTDGGQKLLANVSAAVRATEMELQIRYDEKVLALDQALKALLAEAASHEDAAAINSLHRGALALRFG